MSNSLLADLAECTEIRQILVARPPRIVRGTLLILVTMLGAALLWAAICKVDLVVKAPARVRPSTAPQKAFTAISGETLSSEISGRVVEVEFREGDEVRAGDVLLRLDMTTLENDVARKAKLIDTGRQEITRLGRLLELLQEEFVVEKSKARAKLVEVEANVDRQERLRAADIRLGSLELRKAEEEATRTRTLADRGISSRAELDEASTQSRLARERLERSRIAVDRTPIDSARRILEAVDKEFAVRIEEMEIRLASKRGDVDAAERELANLEIESRKSVLRAHVDGVLTVGNVQVGDLVKRGEPVFAIAQQKGLRVDAAMPGSEVGLLRVGMKARIKFDALDYQKYGTADGEITYISPDSETWTGPDGKQVVTYLVRVALHGDEIGQGDNHGEIKMGMLGQAEVITGEERLLSLAFRKFKNTVAVQ